MKNFKEVLDRDMERTFYNTKEFAEIRKIKYDGTVKEIPVIFDSEETKERNAGADNAEGIHGCYTVIRIQLSRMGREPRQGARLYLENELYRVESVRNEYNELIICLERYDE